jgi:predicted phosphodiesterase
MARRAIISDIHGNLIALKAALADCKAQKVDEIVCLGDVVGYGPDPEECVDLVREHCKWVLQGNHDMAVFMQYPIGFNKIAAQAILYTRKVLEPKWYSFPSTRKRWQWLQNLEPIRKEGDALYVHASPRDPLMEYIEEQDCMDIGFGPTQKIIEVFERFETLCFVGHSHRPGVVNEEYTWLKPSNLENMAYFLEPGRKTLVNVGSVGQPRDRNPDLCYVIFDMDKKVLKFRRLPYDVEAAQKRFKRVKDLHEKCWKRLSEGY